MRDTTTCVYQFIYDLNDIDDTKIIQYFIMNGLVLCIKIDSYVAHVFYACSFSHITTVPIAMKKNKCFISFNTNTAVFAWIDGNSNKKIT